VLGMCLEGVCQGQLGREPFSYHMILKDSHEEGAYTSYGASAQGDAVKGLAASLSFCMGIV